MLKPDDCVKAGFICGAANFWLKKKNAPESEIKLTDRFVEYFRIQSRFGMILAEIPI